MNPIYAEKLIVAIKCNKCFEWYILDRDYCFLDYNKLEKAYRKKGYLINVDDHCRFGIKIVDSSTKDEFLNKIQEYKISACKLKDMLLHESDYNEKLAYNPSLLIDFDRKNLLSHYAEPESFEFFVPDGWEGEYRNFEDIIPLSQRYWIDESGKNLINK